VDVHGRVMGITTAIVGKDYSGIGFAIPSNLARKVAHEIVEDGYVERGYIGMALKSSPPDVTGALVVAVEPKSPAALAGIRPGDLVVAYDGEPVAEPAGLVLQLTRTPIGEQVPLTVVRDGVEETVVVRVGRRPR
jgi:serine protease Do